MAQEKASYVIPITIQPIEGELTPIAGAPIRQEDNEDQKKATDGAKSNANASKALVRQMAGKVGHTALNNFGNITGDYVTQQNIQTAINEGTAIAGAVALGPAGIAIYAVDKVIQGYNYISGLKRSERDAKFRRERVMISTEKS